MEEILPSEAYQNNHAQNKSSWLLSRCSLNVVILRYMVCIKYHLCNGFKNLSMIYDTNLKIKNKIIVSNIPIGEGKGGQL